MITFENPILEKLAPDLISFTGEITNSQNHCDSNEAFGKTICTLGEIQIFAEILNNELLCGQMPTMAIALSDGEPHPAFMHHDAISEDDTRPVSIVFFNHLLLSTKHPGDSFIELAKFMASIWAADSCGVGPESFGDPNSPYVQTLADIFEFIGIDARDLQLISANEATTSFGIIRGGKFDKTANRLIKENMAIDWPERAYRAGLGLICRFSDKTDASKNQQHEIRPRAEMKG